MISISSIIFIGLSGQVGRKIIIFFYAPNFEGHIAFGLSVCVCVCASVNFRTVNGRVLKFHMRIPHEKIVNPYFFSCPSYAPFLSYVPLKTKFESLVCKISQKAFELEPSYLVY